MNGDKAFFDTNILLYVYSTADLRKQSRALELYQEYSLTDRIVLSTQVVQEFFVVALRKLMLPREQIRAAASSFLDLDPIVISATHIRSAMDIEERYKISFWDALIVAAAQAGGAEVIYSEDLSDGQRYAGVLVQNPFAN